MVPPAEIFTVRLAVFEAKRPDVVSRLGGDQERAVVAASDGGALHPWVWIDERKG